MSFLPIPYARSCKITTDEAPLYYIFDYREYPDGTPVKTFARQDLESARSLLESVGKTLSHPPDPATPHRIILNQQSMDKFEKTVKPGGLLIYDPNGITRHPERKDINVYTIEAADEAGKLGLSKIFNMIVLGGFLKLKPLVAPEFILPDLGVVADVRQSSLAAAPTGEMYLAHTQFRFWGGGNRVLRSLSLVLRTTSEPGAMTRSVRSEVATLLSASADVRDVRRASERAFLLKRGFYPLFVRRHPATAQKHAGRQPHHSAARFDARHGDDREHSRRVRRSRHGLHRPGCSETVQRRPRCGQRHGRAGRAEAVRTAPLPDNEAVLRDRRQLSRWKLSKRDSWL